MKILVRFLLCLMISFTLIELPIMKSAHAQSMISTDQVIDHLTRAQDQQKVMEFMGRKEVNDKMIKLGVRPEEARLRLASLSDAEMRRIAGEVDKSTAGGDLGGILILVLLVVLIIYFVKRI